MVRGYSPNLGMGDLLEACNRLLPENDAALEKIAELLGYSIQIDNRIEEILPRISETKLDQERPSDKSKEPEEFSEDIELGGKAVQSRLEKISSESEKDSESAEWYLDLKPIPNQAKNEIYKIFEPLIPVRQTRDVLFQHCSTNVPEGYPLIDDLITKLANGQSISSIPREPIKTIRRGLHVLVDISSSLEPFYRDQSSLIKCITDVFGLEIVDIYWFKDCPSFGVRDKFRNRIKYIRPDSNTPILMLTDFGIPESYLDRKATKLDWVRFIKWVNYNNNPLIAFVPYPKCRWPEFSKDMISMHSWGQNGFQQKTGNIFNQPILDLDVKSLYFRNPLAYDLAVYLSLASRLEPEVVRRARNQLIPGSTAAIEGDLWNSAILESRNPSIIVINQEAKKQLQVTLADNKEKLNLAANVLAKIREKIDYSEILKLEEQITYLSLRKDGGDQEEIDRILKRVVKTIVDFNEKGLIYWAERTLDHAEKGVTKTQGALLLNAIRRQKDSTKTLFAVNNYENIDQILLQTLPKLKIGLRLVETGLEVNTNPDDRYHIISVPNIFPQTLKISSEKQSNDLLIEKDQKYLVSIGDEKIQIKTIDNTSFSLSKDEDFQTLSSASFIDSIDYFSSSFIIESPDLTILKATYLRYLYDHYSRLDFKGTSLLEAMEKASGVPLEECFVPPKVRADLPDGETIHRIAGRMISGGEENEQIAIESKELVRSELLDVSEVINNTQAIVLLGDPGSGKSTFLKMLVLGLASKEDAPLPVLVPLNAYARHLEIEKDCNLRSFLSYYFSTRQGNLDGLAALIEDAIEQGKAVIMLDGLDEIHERRGFVAEKVNDLVREVNIEPGKEDEDTVRPGNRVIVTSRFVGYREAPLTDERWQEFSIQDWNMSEIEGFVSKWAQAVERAVAGGKWDEVVKEKAEEEAEDLLQAIKGNANIQRLAGNPLLCTILALIKRQAVSLPHRRVELYERYIVTMLGEWYKARNLDFEPIGPDLDYYELTQVLSRLALWLRETSPQSGLVTERQLRTFLESYYREEEGFSHKESKVEAKIFIDAVHKYSNLLVERGKQQYGFIHLAFEEYLAGKGLAQLSPDELVEKIRKHILEPGWQDTIRLGIETLGIVNQQTWAAGNIVLALLDNDLEGAAANTLTLLMGEVLRDVGKVGIGSKAAEMVTQLLVAEMQSGDNIPEHRRTVGLLLGESGWVPEDLDEFVKIPAGKFLYGDDKEEREISYDYWMAKYPVTNLQYRRFVEVGGYLEKKYWSEAGWDWLQGQEQKVSRGYSADFSNPIVPVIGVSWYEAEAYVSWMNTQKIANEKPEEYLVRLPNEVEWEYAVRGTDGREYPWGNEYDIHKANMKTEVEGTTAVNTYPQGISPSGVWDMIGNVWEWTSSLYDDKRSNYSIRGGSFNQNLSEARCSIRNNISPGAREDNIGFRVVSFSPDNDFLVNQHLLAFIKNVSLTNKDITFIDRYKEELHQGLYEIPELSEILVDTILFGSIPRGTAIQSSFDIDVLIQLKMNPQKENPQIAYDILKRYLPRVFSGEIIEPGELGKRGGIRGRRVSFSNAFQVKLPEIWLEVLPSVQVGKSNIQSQFLIPDYRRSKWVPTYHEIHDRYTKEQDNMSSGKYSDLIKIIKAWQYFHSPKLSLLSGFSIECLTALYFDPKLEILENFKSIQLSIIEQYQDIKSIKYLPEPGNRSQRKWTGISNRSHSRLLELANTTIDQIRNIEHETNIDRIIEMWRSVFGPEFPKR